MNARPGTLSVRAVNQYRRRDVLTYLGLRYYLYNVAARQDQWARQVSTDVVVARTVQPYFRSQHFKEYTRRAKVEHRPIFSPGPNEALAEAALLDECARHPEAFANPECVFSYALSSDGNRDGIFQHYFPGLQKRHRAIAKACEENPNGVVQYTDIQRFYPSIRSSLAKRIWKERSELAGLSPLYRDLGEKLIDEHAKAGVDQNNILVGPMFSHLLGNLVLRDLDDEFSNNLPVKYFRYVDDIVLVGDPQAVASSFSIVQDHLDDLGFQLHDDSSPKSMKLTTSQWLEGRDDFNHHNNSSISWMTFIGDMKKFLLLRIGEREELKKVFIDEGYRVPVQDYRSAIFESGYLERINNLASRSWFRHISRSISTRTLLEQSRSLRKTCEEEFRRLIDEVATLKGFDRKRRVPKLRYLAGRLIYLATEDVLASLSTVAEGLPELYFHAKVMGAVSSGCIDQLMHLGSNAAQAAAQPMRAIGKKAISTKSELSEVEEMAAVIFLINGVPVIRLNEKRKPLSELEQFSTVGVNLNLMKSKEAFIRELACVHGITKGPRHPEMLETVFDKDEYLAMDAIDQLQQSMS